MEAGFLQRTIRSSVQMMPGSNSGYRSTTETDRLFSPTDGNGYADGVIEFQVADGPQTPATSPGFPAALNRAAWSFDYSVITGLNGESDGSRGFPFVFSCEPGGPATLRR